MSNALFYGDNLEILQDHMPSESIDLVYLDPPFNSNRTYNVLFAEKSGRESQAQIQAFDDTWSWSQESEAVYRDMVEAGSVPQKVADAIRAMRTLLETNDMLAYLVMMAPRLVELHRVLKLTGSLYLHCDPTASHYLKVLLDAVFGVRNFRSEISWRRSSAHSDAVQGRKNFGHIRDVVLFYSKGEDYAWNVQHTPYDQSYIDDFYRHVEPETGRRFRLGDLTGPGGAAKGNPYYEVMGVSRYWRYTREKMNHLIEQGRVVQTAPGRVPAYKRYLDEMPGVPLQDDWDDIRPIGAQAAERLGYPTQKPVALLERIVSASSNPGDVVVDPFCGCGTTISAAQRLGRQWIGIDIAFLSIDLIRTRLANEFGPDIATTYTLHGIPHDVEGARALFQQSPFEFERWAVSLVGGTPNEKQIGDKGIDGIARFSLDGKDAVGRIAVSVKGGGQLNPGMVRDLLGSLDRHDAVMGVLVTLDTPTRGMLDVVKQSGIYAHPNSGRTYPRVQITTVEGLLNRQRPALPELFLPYLKAKRLATATQPVLM